MKTLKLLPIFFLFAFSALAQNTGIYPLATASGTDTYTATLSPAPSAYVNGQRFNIKFTNANTGAATINFNSLGAKSIVKEGGTALEADDIKAGEIKFLVYDGTNMQVVGGGGGVWGDIGGTLSNQTDLNTSLASKAPLASPALTGIPTAPTAASGNNTTQIATTAFGNANYWKNTGTTTLGSTTTISGSTARFQTNSLEYWNLGAGVLFSVSSTGLLMSGPVIFNTGPQFGSVAYYETDPGTFTDLQIVHKKYVVDNFVPGTRSIAGVNLQDNITQTEIIDAVMSPVIMSGTSIAFDVPRTYGYLVPETGNITLNATGLIQGVTQLLIHNHSSEPTFDTEFKIISGTYVTGVDNYIMFHAVKSDLILVTISQEL